MINDAKHRMVYFLGIDLGTSSIKAILVDETGRTVSKLSEGYSIYSPYPGWAEQNPGEWWKATVKAISKILSQGYINPLQIQGIGISGQTHGMVLLDKDFSPLRDAVIWMDQRSIPQVKKLKEKFKGRLNHITGLPIACGFMLPSLLWIRENELPIWNRIYKVLLPKDYIRLKLSGVVASDVTDAGGTLLLDTTKRSWSREIINELNIPYNFFPSLYESSQITGRVTKKAAKEISLKEGTPIFAGGADQVMMAVGSGIVEIGEIASSIGTGGLLVTLTDWPIIKPDKVLHTIPYAINKKWILMGAILSGGSSLNWFLNQIISEELNSRQFLFKKISSTSAASKGLLFLPYLKGERTPYLDPQARGAFIGLNYHHSQSDLIRAVMEGVVFALRDSLEEFKKLGVEPSCVITSGGGAKNELWRHIQADIFNLPIFTTNVEEASAYGASLIAAVGTGIFSTVEKTCKSWIKRENEVIPNPKEVKIYEEVYQIYRGLYPKLRDDFYALSDLGNIS